MTNDRRNLSWRSALALLAALVVSGCGGGEGGTATPAKPVASVELSHGSLLLTVASQERQLSARALDSDGQPVDARINWTSSTPDQVSVDAGGKVRNVTAIGSAQVFAEVDGVRSAPVFVSSVELRPNTLLLRDADIVSVGAPVNVPADEFAGLGAVFDVVVSGIAVPAAGTLVLASETAQVAGRVVDSVVEGSRVRLRLETVSAPDLLARYDVNWVIDLAGYASVMDGEPLTAGTRAAVHGRRHALADRNVLPKWKVPKSGNSPLSCEGSAKAFLKSKPVEVSFEGSPKLEVISSRLDETLPPGRLRVALVGDLVMITRVGLTAEAGLKGDVTCELKSRVPLPFLPPPIGPFVRLAVPVGVGATVAGEVQIASMDISLEGKNGAHLELGIDCGPAPAACRSLDTAQRINEFTPKVELSAAPQHGLGIKLGAQVYLLSGLDVVALTKAFNIIDLKAGPKQSADFGSVERQVDSTSYASSYDLKFRVEVGPGSALRSAIDKLMGGEDRGSLGFSFPLTVDISESPNGTFGADRTRAVPGRDKVKLSVDLKPPSVDYFRYGYNVKSIRLYRRLEGEMEFSFFRTIDVLASNQSRFETEWEPTGQEAGKNEFAAFVVTNLLPGIEPELEVAPNSILEVKVDCLSVPPGHAGSARALAAGTCDSSYVGTATGLIPGLIGYDAVLTWRPDPVRNADPDRKPDQGFYRVTGSVQVRFIVYTDLGCTVTPSEFSRFDPETVLYVYVGTSPPSYSFQVMVRHDLTISCPDQESVTIPDAAVIHFTGAGELTPDGAMIGSTSTPQGSSSYRFAPASSQ